MTADPIAGTQRLHLEDDRCFYCASVADHDGVTGRVVHMDTELDQCPFWAPDDEETP